MELGAQLLGCGVEIYFSFLVGSTKGAEKCKADEIGPASPGSQAKANSGREWQGHPNGYTLNTS